MNLSMRWLDEFVHVDAPIHDYCEALTMSGSKVEGYEQEGADIQNVVVGKVLAMERHPDSDHMWICQVDVGKEEPVQIVTGAQNVRVGDLVPAALHKAHLPGGVVITRGKLRGVESCGMLCSLKELGLTVHDFPYAIEDGIFILQEACAVGEDIRHAIGLMIPSWSSKSPPTAPTVFPSSGWRGKPLPPTVCRCICTPLRYRAAAAMSTSF